MGEDDHRNVLVRRRSGETHKFTSKLGIERKRRPVERTRRLPEAVKAIDWHGRAIPGARVPQCFGGPSDLDSLAATRFWTRASRLRAGAHRGRKSYIGSTYPSPRSCLDINHCPCVARIALDRHRHLAHGCQHGRLTRDTGKGRREPAPVPRSLRSQCVRLLATWHEPELAFDGPARHSGHVRIRVFGPSEPRPAIPLLPVHGREHIAQIRNVRGLLYDLGQVLRAHE